MGNQLKLRNVLGGVGVCHLVECGQRRKYAKTEFGGGCGGFISESADRWISSLCLFKGKSGEPTRLAGGLHAKGSKVVLQWFRPSVH